MDLLLQDERVRAVLGQLPRLLSSTVPLHTKLDELCTLAVDLYEVEAVAVVLFGDGARQVVHSGRLQPQVQQHLQDVDQVRRTVGEATTRHGVPGAPQGVLVSLRDEDAAYGALYVQPREGEELGSDRQAWLEIFATTVGPAIAHGMRMLTTEKARRWSAAAVRLTEQFLAGESDDPYAAIADVVWELGEADVIGIVEPLEDRLDIRVVRGLGLERLAGVSVPSGTPLGRDLLGSGHGLAVDLTESPSAWAAANLPEVTLGPLMAVPLRGAKGPLGVLFLARPAGGPAYVEEDVRIAETFAVNAAVSMEWHAARQTRDELQMLQERNRIARDLHDNVVQRLFATGLYLQQAARTLDGEPKARVESAMVSVDQTIRQIRNTILVLRSTAADRLDKLLATIVDETEPLLGFAPTLTMSHEVSRVTGPLAADLALCVREALSNVVQHAQASAVELEVSVEEGSTVALRISDDGVGIQGERRPGGGLENLDERARAHGGTFTYGSTPGEGTTLRWRMPLPSGAG